MDGPTGAAGLEVLMPGILYCRELPKASPVLHRFQYKPKPKDLLPLNCPGQGAQE